MPSMRPARGVMERLELVQGRVQGAQSEGAALTHLLGQRVTGALGPGQPGFVDLDLVEDLAGVLEAGQVVPMLMGGDQHVDPPAGGGLDVARHGLQALAAVLGAQENAAVDQHIAGAASAGAEGQQEAVAQAADAVHAHFDPTLGSLHLRGYRIGHRYASSGS
jgi:hypothetical protein